MINCHLAGRITAIFFILFTVACNPVATTEQHQPSKLKIVCTTSIIKDVVENIVGDKAEVVGLMGIGVDPHMFKITQQQMQQINQADVLILNGFYLEGKLTTVLRKMRTQKKVLAFADGINTSKLIKIAKYDDMYDPHIWFDIEIWKSAILYISNELQAFDKANKSQYQKNTEAYMAKIDSFNTWAKGEIDKIPTNQRMMITAHDAFQYFSRCFGIEVKALQGISTGHEFGVKEMNEMVEYILDNNIKLVFLENSVPEKWLQTVVNTCEQKGHNVKTKQGLYSDALGDASLGADTYLGMMQANINLISTSILME
jgi:manganese/zinc/iron transport system substrate-binding protein